MINLGLCYLVSHKEQTVPKQPFQASLLRSCKNEPDRKLWEVECIKYRSPTINTQLIKKNNKKIQFSVDTWAVFQMLDLPLKLTVQSRLQLRCSEKMFQYSNSLLGQINQLVLVLVFITILGLCLCPFYTAQVFFLICITIFNQLLCVLFEFL